MDQAPHQSGDNPQNRVYVVSYPNSGRTWLRVLLSRYKQLLVGIEKFQIKLHSQFSADPYTPQYIFYHAKSADIPMREPLWRRIIGRDEIEYVFDASLYAYSRLILLVRSPKDTMVSSYHEKGTRKGLFKGSLSEFIRDPRFGLERWIHFHNFMQTHRRLDAPDALLISYEGLKKKPQHVLTRILQLSNSPQIDAYLQDAVIFSSFENMKQLEMSNQLIRSAESDAETNLSKRKVRVGSVGGYKDVLSTEDIAYIDDALRKNLSSFYLEQPTLNWLEK